MASTTNFEILALQTTTVPPYTSTNTIFYGRKNFVIVDPGCHDPAEQDKLAHAIDQRIARGDHLSAVLITHHHGDHTKAARFVVDRFRAQLFAHKNAAHHVSLPISRFLDDNDEIILGPHNSLRAYYTPGHSDDHLVFFNPDDGVLIAGDMITDRGTVLIPPPNGSLTLYLNSLDRLARLPIKTLIPAHGSAITERPDIFLRNAIKHRIERILAILETLEEKPNDVLDATDITLLVYKHLSSNDLIVFAQLSVESSLSWLSDNDFVEHQGGTWRLKQYSPQRKHELLTQRLTSL